MRTDAFAGLPYHPPHGREAGCFLSFWQWIFSNSHTGDFSGGTTFCGASLKNPLHAPLL
jgi:hypothetical protein